MAEEDENFVMCPRCGAMRPKTDEICGKCGASLGEKEPEEPEEKKEEAPKEEAPKESVSSS